MQTAGLQFGSAAATPLIAVLMESHGWKNALLWTDSAGAGGGPLWSWYGRDSPKEHPSVSAAELAELKGTARRTRAGFDRRVLHAGARQPDVLLLAISYTIMNYVFYLLAPGASCTWCRNGTYRFWRADGWRAFRSSPPVSAPRSAASCPTRWRYAMA